MSTTPLILVCDDQVMVHEALGVYLQNEGYQMVSAYDGAEALKLVEEKKPDLIILDLMMPQISGIEVCREQRAHLDADGQGGGDRPHPGPGAGRG